MRFLIEITDNGFTKLSPVPARMGLGEASQILGISKTDLAHLIAEGELSILGTPERNQEKFLCAADVLDKAQDKRWLSRMTDLLYGFHAERRGKPSLRHEEKSNGRATRPAVR